MHILSFSQDISISPEKDPEIMIFLELTILLFFGYPWSCG